MTQEQEVKLQKFKDDHDGKGYWDVFIKDDKTDGLSDSVERVLNSLETTWTLQTSPFQ